MLMTSCLVLILNLILFLYYREGWTIQQMSAGLSDGASSLRVEVLSAMVVEIVFFILAIIGMGIMTAHRIAGPYVRLRSVFNEVGGGNMDCRLRFRSYDGLEDLEAAFNRMMDTLQGKQKAGGDSGATDGNPERIT